MMEYAAFVFGIFGLFAYLQSSSLKKRVIALEEELAGIAGTSSFEERRALLDADGDWILVRIDSAKGSKEKLIRAGSVQGISVVNEM